MRAIVFASFVACVSAGLFKNHHLFAVNATSDSISQWLVNSRYDLWNEPIRGRPSVVQMRVAPEDVETAKEGMKSIGAEYVILDDDIEPEFETQVTNRTGYKRGVSKLADFNYFEYHPYIEIIDWIFDMHAQYPTLTEIVHIGWSYEERQLLALKITGPGTNSTSKKKSFHNFAIHAREWLTPASGLYMAAQLCEQYTTAADVKFLVDNIEWVFLMVTNPDGYHETWTNNRLWRKTRSPNAGSTCIGKDANRNFAFEWGNNDGSSGDPCSDTYRGPTPFSEPETSSVARYLAANQFDGYIDWHCCGAMWMTPWGYTTTLPRQQDYEVQMQQSISSTNAIYQVRGTQYAYGPSSIVIYVTSGSTVDWTYGTLGIVLSVTVELPGTHTSPSSAIEPTVKDVWAGIKAYGFSLLNNRYHLHSDRV